MPTHPLCIVTFIPFIRLVCFLEYSGHMFGLGQYHAHLFFLVLFSMCLILVRSYHLPIDFVFSSSHCHATNPLWYMAEKEQYNLWIMYKICKIQWNLWSSYLWKDQIFYQMPTPNLWMGHNRCIFFSSIK